MKKSGLFLAWIIACIATLGSLYFGEITHHEPCTLCWYQRIAIFPLSIILGIAFFQNNYNIVVYALPLSIIGFALSLVHVLLQYAPESFLEVFCTSESCVVKRSLFGKGSLSFVSLVSFALLNFFLLLT